MTGSSNNKNNKNHQSAMEQELGLPQDATLTLALVASSNKSNNNSSSSSNNSNLLFYLQPKNQSTTTEESTRIAIAPSTSIQKTTDSTSTTPNCLIVGRQVATADIRINHGSISRKHAILYFTLQVLDNATTVTPILHLMDLGGKHGCTINQRKMNKKDTITLNHGDEIQFGNVREQIFIVIKEEGEQKQNDDTQAIKQEEESESTQEDGNKKEETIKKSKPPSIDPNLKGRERREAEIAAMMESLDETPTYTSFPSSSSSSQEVDNSKNDISQQLPTSFSQTNVQGSQSNNVEKSKNITNTTTTIIDNNNTNTNNSNKENNRILQITNKYKIPLTSTLTLPPPPGASTTTLQTNQVQYTQNHILTSISLDPSGARLLTTSTDATIRLYDFGGMNLSSLDKPFKIIRLNQEGNHPITSSTFSNTGQFILIGSTSAQPMILDRDGREVMEFIKGDPYVTDMVKTVGHISSVLDVAWHPLEMNLVITCSTDGSTRVWDIERNSRQFDKLTCCLDAKKCRVSGRNKDVYRIKDRKGRRVQAVTCISIRPGGKEFVVGTKCGSIQLWKIALREQVRPVCIYNTHGFTYDVNENQVPKPITALCWNLDGTRLASRSMDDDVVKVWDKVLRKTSKPLMNCIGFGCSLYESSNCTFSPDGRLLCGGTSVTQQSSSKFYQGGGGGGDQSSTTEYGMLKIYRVDNERIRELKNGSENNEPIIEIDVAMGISAVIVVWHAKLNQIFLGLSDGSLKIYYSNDWSTKGALSCASRGIKKQDELSLLLASRVPTGSAGMSTTDSIQTPHALPLFRDNERSTKRKRDKERHDPVKTRKPQPPATGIKMGEGTSASLNFQQFVTNTTGQTKNIAGKDPREEWFKYSTGKKKYTETGYDGDKKVLAEKTVEEEEEEMKQMK